jgi:hypothetical protein
LVRLSWGGDPSGRLQGANIRINIWGMLIVSMMIFDSQISPGNANALIRRYLKDRKESIVIEPKRKIMTLKRGELTWVEEYEPQIHRQRAIERNSR